VSLRITSTPIDSETDVVRARQHARQIAALLGFDHTEQIRIATAVSEIARNAYAYAGRGRIDFAVEGVAAPQVLLVVVEDAGPGITDVDAVLSGANRSATGAGLGIAGARRLVDRFAIQSSRHGTTVTLRKILPKRTLLVDDASVQRMAAALAEQRPSGPLHELQEQNRELLRALGELQTRRDELERVNRELEDTNRGVVALYGELDERASHLRRADELKTRFLSNMTHEFRTPVNSILALTNLLAERLAARPDDKDELYYIRKSAQQLSDLVDDLLDIAKVEAGKIEVRPAPFEVSSLFSALRGVLRPLLVNQSVHLAFDELEPLPPLFTDETKVSQILRNFISNALKYTEAGEVRVSARLNETRDSVVFAVADTGIGIPEQFLDRVFDEFAQIENPLQRRTKGTGLGLPLAKRLAELLGGSIAVTSALGSGSTFSVVIPLMYRGVGQGGIDVKPGMAPVLVVEDSDEDLLVVERMLAGTRFQLIPARSVAAAAIALEAMTPSAIVMDLRLQGVDSWDAIARLKRQPGTKDIPLIVVSSFDDRQKGLGLGADAYGVKPIQRQWLLETLETLTPPKAVRVLVIDDEEAARYIVRELLKDGEHHVFEAASEDEGLRLIEETAPDVVLLDLNLGDRDGLALLEALRRDSRTARLPVVVVSSQHLSPESRQRLSGVPVLSKGHVTRMTLRAAMRDAMADNVA
jgi:signal transduction histidine kinase/CheY-like chemotaxis protein